jgi:hypothetical protein
MYHPYSRRRRRRKKPRPGKTPPGARNRLGHASGERSDRLLGIRYRGPSHHDHVREPAAERPAISTAIGTPIGGRTGTGKTLTSAAHFPRHRHRVRCPKCQLVRFKTRLAPTPAVKGKSRPLSDARRHAIAVRKGPALAELGRAQTMWLHWRNAGPPGIPLLLLPYPQFFPNSRIIRYIKYRLHFSMFDNFSYAV